MTPLRQRMLEDMQLKGFSERTQECYLRSVRQLAQHYNKSPDQISEEDLRKLLPSHQERQEVEACYRYHRSLRHQVLLHPNPQKAVDNLRPHPATA